MQAWLAQAGRVQAGLVQAGLALVALALVALAPIGAAQGRSLATHRTATNVVVIVMDDIGIEQLACYDDVNQYASPYAYASTPTIDALAASGARFTQVRTSPNCSPSRSCLLTGRYAFRTGCGALVQAQNATSSFAELGNPIPELALPAILPGTRKSIGKWHLGLDLADGGTMPDHPLSLGFDSWSGILRNLVGQGQMPSGTPGYYNFLWWENGVPTQIQGIHATIYTRREASEWLANAQRPFFLWLAFNAPHQRLSPENAPPSTQHGFGTITNGYDNTGFRAQLECLDRQLGIFLSGLPPQTLVVLVGDNGTTTSVLQPASGEPRYPTGHPLHQPGDESTQLSVAPYPPSRSKGTAYETGVRVPLIVAGPGVVAGVRSDLVDMVDFFATVAWIRGVGVPIGSGTDSVSFAGVLSGGAGARSFSFVDHFAPNGVGQVLAKEDRCYLRPDGVHLWKLVRQLGLPDEFYDVASDPLETTDLGTSHAEYQATADALAALLAS